MMSLVKAIDDLLAFVGNRHTIPRTEMAMFYELDERVFMLAFEQNLHSALPPQCELERPLYDSKLRPLQFEGRTNLPGDWEPLEFCPIAEGRWTESLRTLQKLAEARDLPIKRTGRPNKEEPSKDVLVVAALALHHQYEPGGSIGNYEPAIVRQLANDRISTAAISRFLKSKFPNGHKGYKAACQQELIGGFLAKWQGDIPEGMLDLTPGEYGRRGQ